MRPAGFPSSTLVVVVWKCACWVCLFVLALVNQLSRVKKQKSCAAVVYYLGEHGSKMKGG